MKKLLKKTILLAVLTVVVVTISQSAMNLPTDVAYYAISKASEPNNCSDVILGDSVCNQIWNQKENLGELCTLSSNQAITPCGSYLLLHTYLDAHPSTKTVYYAVRPQSLANDMWTNFTYQYFVLPFYNDENLPLIEDETKELLYEKFGKPFVTNQYLKMILSHNQRLQDIYLARVQTGDNDVTNRLSRTAAIYLRKMQALCEERGVKFVVRPLPLADTPENQDWNLFRQDIADYGFEDLLKNFIDDVDYYPLDWFVDGVHFTPDILAEHLETFRSRVLRDY